MINTNAEYYMKTILAYIVIGIMVLSLVSTGDVMAILSPFKQIKLGILPQDVKCSRNHVLLIRTTDGHPFCVKQVNVTRLLQRDWVYPEKYLPKPDNNGVIDYVLHSVCVPKKIDVNGSTSGSRFDIININFPSQGQLNFDGITALSSSKEISMVPYSIGSLIGHYNLEKNSTIVNCGIEYCEGENCNPGNELRVTNTYEFVNVTKGSCPVCDPKKGMCLGISCRGPSVSTETSISAQTPPMDPGVPYLYKFYLVDNRGNYDEWFSGLEYKPP